MSRVRNTKDWVGAQSSTRGIGLTPVDICATICIVWLILVVIGCSQSDRSNAKLVSVEPAIVSATTKPRDISEPTTPSTGEPWDVSKPTKQPTAKPKSLTGPYVTFTPIGPGSPRIVFLNDLVGTGRENVIQRLGRPLAGRSVFDVQRGEYMPTDLGWYGRSIWHYRIYGQVGGFPLETRQHTVTIFFDTQGKVSKYSIN